MVELVNIIVACVQDIFNIDIKVGNSPSWTPQSQVLANRSQQFQPEDDNLYLKIMKTDFTKFKTAFPVPNPPSWITTHQNQMILGWKRAYNMAQVWNCDPTQFMEANYLPPAGAQAALKLNRILKWNTLQYFYRTNPHYTKPSTHPLGLGTKVLLEYLQQEMKNNLQELIDVRMNWAGQTTSKFQYVTPNNFIWMQPTAQHTPVQVPLQTDWALQPPPPPPAHPPPQAQVHPQTQVYPGLNDLRKLSKYLTIRIFQLLFPIHSKTQLKATSFLQKRDYNKM